MTVTPPSPVFGADALKQASCVPVDILPPEGAGGDPGEAIVPTRPWSPPVKGRQGAALRRGVDIQRVRGYKTREEIIKWHVYHGLSLKETALKVGRHPNWVGVVWKGIVASANGKNAMPEEHRDAVRAYADRHLRRVIETAQGLIGEAAAYGAVVVAGCKALAELHGLKVEDVAPEGLSLADVGREVRVVSPLLIEKMAQVKALQGVCLARSEATSEATTCDNS